MTQPLDDGDLREMLLTALGTEHAAIWVYGLVSAFLPASTATGLAAASLAHRERRDAVVALLARDGIAAPPAAAAYRPPSPVTDAASAAGLAAVAEDDVAAAWRAVAERTEAATGRRAAPARARGGDRGRDGVGHLARPRACSPIGRRS